MKCVAEIPVTMRSSYGRRRISLRCLAVGDRCGMTRAWSIILPALRFTTANDAFTHKRTMSRSDDRALAFTLAAVVIDHHPMCASSIRQNHGIVSFASLKCRMGNQASRVSGVGREVVCSEFPHETDFGGPDFYSGLNSFNVFSSHARASSTDERFWKGANLRGEPSRIFKEQKGRGLRAASHL
jgi:hypothetical protein